MDNMNIACLKFEDKFELKAFATFDAWKRPFACLKCEEKFELKPFDTFDAVEKVFLSYPDSEPM